MKKRGQVTTFMIVGIVIIIIVFLLFALKDSILEGVKGKEGTKQILAGVIEDINNKVKDCISQESNNAVLLLGKQGGSFDPVNFRTYKKDKITYLCFKISNSTKCANSGLTRLELENELNDYLNPRIKQCINIESFRDDRRYDMNYEDFNLKTNILDKSVLFNVTFPIMLKRNGVDSSVSAFSKSIDVPLGKLQTAVVDVLNEESDGIFDNVIYTMHKRNEFVVIQINYYPDKIYILHYKNSPYIFQFAVKG